MPTPDQMDHVDVGAYLLGILDDADDAAFAQHFARCARCRAEYRELSDLPMLLDQLKPAHRESRPSRAPAAPGKRVLGQALARVGAARRVQHRTMLLIAGAAAVLLVAIPLIVVRSSGSEPQVVAGPTMTVSVPAETTGTSETGTDVVAGARTVTGISTENGVSATIGFEPEVWGTKVNLEFRSNTGPVWCVLVAVPRTGESMAVVSWQVPAGGVGVPASPEPLRLQGSVGIAAENILRFEVRRSDGPVLLDIIA